MTSGTARWLWALYLVAIVYLSFYPGEFLLHPRGGALVWIPLVGRRQIMDAVLNVFFYAPLGALTVWALGSAGWAWPVAVAVAAAISGVIEWLQLWSATRYGNLTDLTMNVLGAAVGATVASGLRTLSLRVPMRWAVPPEGTLFLALWVLWHGFPFVPAVNLLRATRITDHLAPWSWSVAIAGALCFWVLRDTVGPSRWVWAAYAVLLAQAVLVNHNLSPAALCGAAVGWMLPRALPRWQAGLFLVWLLWEQFRPFTFVTGTPANWLPFHSWYDAPDATAYYGTVFGKLSLYTAALWSVRRVAARRGWLLPAIVVAAGEWSQQYLPGRTPESTDIILLALGYGLLEVCRRWSRSQV